MASSIACTIKSLKGKIEKANGLRYQAVIQLLQQNKNEIGGGEAKTDLNEVHFRRNDAEVTWDQKFTIAYPTTLDEMANETRTFDISVHEKGKFSHNLELIGVTTYSLSKLAGQLKKRHQNTVAVSLEVPRAGRPGAPALRLAAEFSLVLGAAAAAGAAGGGRSHGIWREGEEGGDGGGGGGRGRAFSENAAGAEPPRPGEDGRVAAFLARERPAARALAEAHKGEPPNELHVWVLRGRRFASTEHNVGFGDYSVEAEVRHIEDTRRLGGARKTKAETEWVRDQLDPVWVAGEDADDGGRNSSAGQGQGGGGGEDPHGAHLVLGVADHRDFLRLSVRRRGRLGGSELVGLMVESLRPLLDGQFVRSWTHLRNARGRVDHKPRGMLEVAIQWVHNPARVKPGAVRKKFLGVGLFSKHLSGKEDKKGRGAEEPKEEGGASAPLLGGEEEEEDGDASDEEAGLEETEVQDTDDEGEEAHSDHEGDEPPKEVAMRGGDWVCQIHVIEARDLHPEDLDGLADPIVTVEALGQKYTTAEQPKTLNPVFDEKFLIDAPGLGKDEVEDAVITVSIYDADFGTKRSLIGKFVVDASYVYGQRHHEMHRKWVAVIDDEDPEDVGVQGYLKLSIALAGPGQELRPHDDLADAAKEAREAKGKGLDPLQPPTVRLETKWLRSQILYAEHLPEMDAALTSGGQNSIDAFVQCRFGAARPVNTAVRTVEGTRAELSPEWNEELWFPCQLPTLQTKIAYTIYDKDGLLKVEAARFISNFNEVDRETKKLAKAHAGRKDGKKAPLPPAKWVNLYGPHVLPWRTQNLLNPASTKAHKTYLANPKEAPAFLGRLLLRQAVVDPKALPGKYKEEKTPFRRQLKGVPLAPPAAKYSLSALVLTGSNLPLVKDSASLGFADHSFHVRVACAGATVVTRQLAADEAGNAAWAELLQTDFLGPGRAEDLADVFVYLCVGPLDKMYPVCFKRLAAKELLRLKAQEENQLGNRLKMAFHPEKIIRKVLEWSKNKDRKPMELEMQQDLEVGKVKNTEYPGSLRVQITLKQVTEEDFAHEGQSIQTKEEKWLANYTGTKEPAHFHVHIFQARALPPVDANGGCDPYLTVAVPGARPKRTEVRKATLYPVYYQTLCFHATLDRQASPMIKIQVYDADLGRDEYVGCAMVPPEDWEEHLPHFDHTNRAPRPKEYQVYAARSADGVGTSTVLASVQYRRARPGGRDCPAPPPIDPPTREATLEVLVLGLRELDPGFAAGPPRFPSLHFELPPATRHGQPQVMVSANSKRPSARDPNMLQKLQLDVELPEDPIFATPLAIKAVDFRLGGLHRPILGIGEAPLAGKAGPPGKPPEVPCKIPWAEGYRSPHYSFAEHEDEAAAPAPPAPALDDGGVGEEKGEGAAGSKAAGGDDGRGALAGSAAAAAAGEGTAGAATKSKKKAFEDDEFDDFPSTEPKYMKHRETLEMSLEKRYGPGPFETFQLFLGSKLDGTFRKAGYFKGIVVVKRREDKDKQVLDYKQFLKPQRVVCRLYVLAASGLKAMDVGFGGRQGKSDPYLVCSLGKTTINKRKEYVADSIDPDLYQAFEFVTELPGTSLLTVQVKDLDDFGSDDVIGETTIDLEDRWFDKNWVELGKEYEKPPINENGVVEKDPRFSIKPIELRPIFSKTGGSRSQGSVQCWIDIMTVPDASAYAPIDIALPADQVFEVRVVIWKTKGVDGMDMGGMTDMYCRSWVEGCRQQDTDTHWRCANGKGSFNWRLLFKVQLGHNTRAMKFPYLHIQIWDKDILKWNDCLCEGLFDMGAPFHLAYNQRKMVKVYDNTRKKTNKKKAQEKKKEQKTKLTARQIKAEQGKASAKLLKERLGFHGEPPDSKWLPLSRQEFKENGNNKKIQCGQVCVSVEVWPGDQAEAQPAGAGRGEPNANPHLPPPQGRLHFSLNPFSMLSQLLGPRICCYLSTLFCCFILVVFAFYMGPTLISNLLV